MRIFLVVILTISALVSLAFAQSSACSQPHSEVGHCKARMPAWSFNSQTKKCVKFNYGGCGGNGNRFPSQASCERQCIKSSGKTDSKKL